MTTRGTSAKGKELGLQQIWRDDKFTYLRGQFQETPALYELKDGKGSLINFDFNAWALHRARSSWRTAISPSASRRSNSTAREARSSHDGTESKYARHHSRTAGGEATAQEEYAGGHRTGGDPRPDRHRQRIQPVCAATRRAAPASALPMRPASPSAQQVSSFETQQQLQAQHDAEERQRQQS